MKRRAASPYNRPLKFQTESIVSDRLAVLPQYFLPKQALTVIAGKLASRQAGSLTTSVIRWFVGRYKVNMAEAANPDITSYKSIIVAFNDSNGAGNSRTQSNRQRCWSCIGLR